MPVPLTLAAPHVGVPRVAGPCMAIPPLLPPVLRPVLPRVLRRHDVAEPPQGGA
jgi:hypothetical protein